EYTIKNTKGNTISNKWTLLHIMSYFKYPYEEIEPLIEKWIEQGGDTKEKDVRGRVALHLAAINANTRILKLLLSLKAKDTITDSDGKLALHYACERCEKEVGKENNMYDIIESLLEPFALKSAGWQISTEPSKAGSQSTEPSLSEDPLKIVREKEKKDLLDYINRLDKKGNSPLYYISKAMYKSLTKFEKPGITNSQKEGLKSGYKQAEKCYLYLKEHLADPNKDNIKAKKLEILMLDKDLKLELVDSQVTKSENYIKYFMDKVKEKELEKIEKLAKIIKVNSQINEGRHTILYWLIDNEHKEVARILVEEAEEEELQDLLKDNKSSICPLYVAVKKGEFQLVKMLIYEKAIKKYIGRYAAQIAADSVESEVVKERGGAVTRRYENGKTLLDAACESGSLAIVKLILESIAICTEKYENDQSNSLPANQIMGELKYLLGDTSGYDKTIRGFIEEVRQLIKGTRKYLDNEANLIGVSGQVVCATRQKWRDKENRIWEQQEPLVDHEVDQTQGAAINAADEVGLTSLPAAAQEGHPADAAVLEKQEQSKNLIKAASQGGIEQVKLLLKAASQGDIEQVKLLLSQGAAINATDKDGWTPLHWAAKNGHQAVVAYLKERGADINATCKYGGTPLHWAAQNGQKELAEYLQSEGADTNATCKYGGTPLHWAAKNGQKELVEYLLAQKAGINAKTKDGWTPLHWAAAKGHQALVEYLLEQGADSKAVDEAGRTPLHWAAAKGHQVVVAYLKEQGADINATCKDDWTPLHLAAQSGHQVVVEYLLEQGADSKAVDEDGRTPLHLAAKNGHRTVVAYLKEQGADINATANDGWTPLHLAALSGHQAVVEYLLGQGAEVNAKDKQGKTSLHWAAKKDHTTVVELLKNKGAKE
ncbi:MAG: ankyrin repeat domain-containing protein, partial [Cytophagales bacterium]|nr:ankyrin repeat domain-containing protein [Cytophagales bacterium]